MIHALHIHELAQESGLCRLAAVSTLDKQAADKFHTLIDASVPVFDNINALANSGTFDVAVIATNTDSHREHSLMMIRSGRRVFQEKPLTGTLEGDREYAALLEREYPHSLMLGFQKRFDAPLLYARQLIDEGAIGRIFKIYTALEDSCPAPNGFSSPGILPDMAVHNVDEIV
ncbi:MAG TPA: Gfo/Idh/MocA family oxidoreductase, partial [Terracidiphilus sp.]